MKHGHLGVHSPWEALSPQRDQQLIENGQQSSMTAPSGKRPFHDLAKASLRWTEKKNIFGSKYGPQNGVQNWITFSFHFLSLCLGPGPRFGVQIWTQKWCQPSENLLLPADVLQAELPRTSMSVTVNTCFFSLCVPNCFLYSRGPFPDPVLGAMMDQVCCQTLKSLAAECLLGVRLGLLNFLTPVCVDWLFWLLALVRWWLFVLDRCRWHTSWSWVGGWVPRENVFLPIPTQLQPFFSCTQYQFGNGPRNTAKSQDGQQKGTLAHVKRKVATALSVSETCLKWHEIQTLQTLMCICSNFSFRGLPPTFSVILKFFVLLQFSIASRLPHSLLWSLPQACLCFAPSSHGWDFPKLFCCNVESRGLLRFCVSYFP